jgi:soluble lytic murein transglycosylase-like protein
MQVMGQTAREHGFTGKFLNALCDQAVGLSIGCAVLSDKLCRTRGNPREALLLWNGGTNTDYPGQVIGRISKYK